MALWRSQSIQVVWFLTAADLNVDNFYQGLFGLEPDRLERQKSPNAANPFTGIAAGTIDGLSVVVQLQPGRVDLTVQPDMSVVLAEDFPPVLDTEAAVAWLEDRLSNSADHFPVALRIAIVCFFLKSTSSLDEARSEIAGLVGLDERLHSYSDFMFQLNRRTIGKETGVEFNRLLRWGTIAFQNVVFNLPSHPGAQGGQVSEERHAASLMVDLNTVLGTKIFKAHEQLSIFHEMFGELRRLGEDRTPLSLMTD